MLPSERFVLNIFLVMLLWVNECVADPKLSENMLKMKAVKDKIFNGYDKTVRPTREGSNTTEIDTGMWPKQIMDVDEEKGLFILDSYFWMAWEDPRLMWNTTDFNGYLQLPTELLWVPDITVHNSHSMQANPVQQVLLAVSPSGTVFWVPPLQTQTSCPMLSKARYPDEEITCIIKMGSWMHDGWEINFSHAEHLYFTDFDNINPRWELIVSQTKLVRNVTYYEGYSEPYLSLDAYFPIKRRPVPEIEATRKPCILIMLLTLSIFWLPPDSSNKVLLGGILSLALIIMLAYVAYSTKYPLAVTYAVSFLQSTMYILVTTILLQVFIIFNLCKLSGPVRPPPAAMQLLTGPFGKYACLRCPTSDDIPIDRVQLKEDSTDSTDSPTPRDDWMLFAAGLDRLFFVLMSIAMIAVHHL